MAKKRNLEIGDMELQLIMGNHQSGIEIGFPRGGEASLRSNADQFMELLAKSLTLKGIPVELLKAESDYLVRDPREKATPALLLAETEATISEINQRLEEGQKQKGEELTGELNPHVKPAEENEADLAAVLKGMIYEKTIKLGREGIGERAAAKTALLANELRRVIHVPLIDFNRTSAKKIDAQTIATEIAPQLAENRQKSDAPDDAIVINEILTKHLVSKPDDKADPEVAAKQNKTEKALISYLGENILRAVNAHFTGRNASRGG